MLQNAQQLKLLANAQLSSTINDNAVLEVYSIPPNMYNFLSPACKRLDSYWVQVRAFVQFMHTFTAA